MRILFVTNNAYLYGANMSMLDLAKNLKKSGHEIYVVSNQKGSIEEACNTYGINYYYHHSFWCTGGIARSSLQKLKNNFKAAGCLIGNILGAPVLIRYIKENEIDIVHTNNLCSIDGVISSHFANVPHVWHVREFLEEDYSICFLLSKKLMKRFFSWSDAFVFISKAIAKKHRDVITAPSFVIHDGISFTAQSEAKNLSNRFIYMFSGVFQEKKGVKDAVKAFVLVAKEDENCELWIVGDTSKNEKLMLEIQQILNAHHLNERVNFLGFRKDMESVMPKANCGLVCSSLEGLGRVTVEYMRSNVVVIGSNTGGTREIIKDGENGFLYKCGDVEDLAEKMKFVRMHYQSERFSEIRKNALDYSAIEFSPEGYALKMLGLYDSILNK